MSLFLQSPLLAARGVVHGFSLRDGGVSSPPFDSLNLGGHVGDDPASVAENLSRFLAALGVDPRTLSTATQVHGDRVVTAPVTPDVEADALVAGAGLAVGVRTADCVPILLFDPDSGAAAAVHAGWRGTVASIAAKAVDRLVASHGARPSSLIAAVGPAIGPCCFEVGDEVAAEFADEPTLVDRTRGPKPHLDLWRANRLVLERAGLEPAHIEIVARCTFCDPKSFFSHRRDAGRTGRHLAVIAARSGRDPHVVRRVS